MTFDEGDQLKLITSRKYFDISIPFAVPLTKRENWNQPDGRDDIYRVIRFHFQLKPVYRKRETIVHGPSFLNLESPSGATISYEKEDSSHAEYSQFEKSTIQHLSKSEVLSKIASDLSTKVGLFEGQSLSSTLKSEIATSVSESLVKGKEIGEASKVTSTSTVRINYAVDPGNDTHLLGVVVYKKLEFEVIFSWIDFLEVHYKRRLLGVKRIAKKAPVITNYRKHCNPPILRSSYS